MREDRIKEEYRDEEKASLVMGLKEKLNWYTMRASDEEYDEKAVESILYLLDQLEPLDKNEMPAADEAWGRFQELLRERGEERPVSKEAFGTEEFGDLEPPRVWKKTGRFGLRAALEKADMGREPEGRVVLEVSKFGDGLRKQELEEARERLELGKAPEKAEFGSSLEKSEGRDGVGKSEDERYTRNGKTAKRSFLRLQEKRTGGVLHYKYVAAAVLLLLVMSVAGVIGNVSVGASPDTGFFHWLRRDNTGTQMLTSPENLDSNADMQGVHIYKNSEDVPSWAQEWLEIDGEFEMPEGYVWKHFEVEEPRNFRKIVSFYYDQNNKREMFFGMMVYLDEISFNTEWLATYSFLDIYEIGEKQMNIYSKTEESGKQYYLVYFFENNSQYFIQGQESLDELKGLAEQYLLWVKNNLEKNEIICNKMLSQAIYK